MGKLIIKKSYKWYHLKRNFQIYHNDFVIGEVGNRKALELKLLPGKYIFKIKNSWLKKQTKAIEIKPNETVELELFY